MKTVRFLETMFRQLKPKPARKLYCTPVAELPPFSGVLERNIVVVPEDAQHILTDAEIAGIQKNWHERSSGD